MNLKDYLEALSSVEEYAIPIFVTIDEFDRVKTELLKISPSFRKHTDGVFVFDHYNSEIILSTIIENDGMLIGTMLVGKKVYHAIYTKLALMKEDTRNMLWFRTRFRQNVGESFKLLEKRNSEYEVVSL